MSLLKNEWRNGGEVGSIGEERDGDREEIPRLRSEICFTMKCHKLMTDAMEGAHLLQPKNHF